MKGQPYPSDRADGEWVTPVAVAEVSDREVLVPDA